MGVSSAPIGAAESLIALKAGVVDGQNNGNTDFIGSGHADANKHLSPINFILSGLGVWMSPGKWAQMTAERQGWLTQASMTAGEDGKAIFDIEITDAFAQLKGLGVTVTEPDIDAFRAAIMPWIEETDGKAWPAGQTELINGL